MQINVEKMILSSETYNEILEKIQNHKGSHEDIENMLHNKYRLPFNTVCSIISIETKRKMKKLHHKIMSMNQTIFDRYSAIKNSNDNLNVMLRLGEELDIPYTLLAKTILEKYYEQDENSVSAVSKSSNIKNYLKDSTLIEDKELAYEVFLCQIYDNQYGNLNDIIRQSFGQEYEYHLQEIVKEKNFTFQSEDDLRGYGYDKTPDIKLDIPFAVDGFIINWIEGKALFGDPQEHQNYVRDQYSSYWNRFGTGLVIYWLGMVDTVMCPSEKRFIVRTDFPMNYTIYDPFAVSKMFEVLSDKKEADEAVGESNNSVLSAN